MRAMSQVSSGWSSKTAWYTIAVASVAALAAISACADNPVAAGTDRLSIPDPRLAGTVGGNNHKVVVCVDIASSPGTYSFAGAALPTGVAPFPWFELKTSSDPDLSGFGITQNSTGPFNSITDNDVITANVTASPGECKDIFVRADTCPVGVDCSLPANNNGNRLWTDANGTTNPYGSASITATIPAGYTFSVNCVNDDPTNPIDCSNGGYGSANIFHGAAFTFKFTAPVLAEPQFVIGDVEPHSPPLELTGVSASATSTQGDLVNFWGAQWFKYNFMSGFVSPGASGGSFKGYASKVNGSCGGTWESRVGNSPPPPPDINQPLLIIVTSTVQKNGPVLSGDIVQIVEVLHNGGYDDNPGHRGWGYVTRIVCTVDD